MLVFIDNMKNKYDFCWMNNKFYSKAKFYYEGYRKDKNQNERKKKEFKSFNNLIEKFKESLKI